MIRKVVIGDHNQVGRLGWSLTLLREGTAEVRNLDPLGDSEDEAIADARPVAERHLYPEHRRSA